MTSNSTQIAEREFAAGTIEGVDFGTRLWVIARSPTAVLVWVYGHSASINGFQRYYQPHLTILPDRTPAFASRPSYKSLRHEWTRLTPARLVEFEVALANVFGGLNIGLIERAVKERKTAIIDGGGGALTPPGLYGHAHIDWIKNPDNGFIMLPAGMTRHESYRRKLGWKPEDA